MPGKLELPCISVRALIRVAYGGILAGGNLVPRRIDVIGGPGWLDTETYDISAMAEGAATIQQVTGPMLQALLEDRCQLKAHKETRDTAVYLLTLARNGPKLQTSKPGGCVPVDLSDMRPRPAKPGDASYCGGGHGHRTDSGQMAFEWYGISMAELAGRAIAPYVDRPVVEKTGLTGRYDIHLEFVPEPIGGAMTLNGVPAAPQAPDDGAGPTIFTALEKQLGLKLTPGKSPVDVIVVDHVEKPSAN